MIELIERGAEFVSDEIWYRVVQMVVNEEALQEYRCAADHHKQPNQIISQCYRSFSSGLFSLLCALACFSDLKPSLSLQNVFYASADLLSRGWFGI
jgi:hypothetical protein